jgi:hypothetical protein
MSISSSRYMDGLSCFRLHKALQHFLFSAAIYVYVSFPLTLHAAVYIDAKCVHVVASLPNLSHFDLGRFPALRHFKFQQRISTRVTNVATFLSQLLSIFSPTSGIETIELEIAWMYAYSGFGEVFCSSLAELDELLSSKRFGSLKKFVLRLDLMTMKRKSSWVTFHNQERVALECERNSTLPYINALLPRFRASTDTLEIYFTVH